jgi:hypothetical protein
MTIQYRNSLRRASRRIGKRATVVFYRRERRILERHAFVTGKIPRVGNADFRFEMKTAARNSRAFRLSLEASA